MNIDEKLGLCYDIIMQSAHILNARGIRTGYTHWLGPELAKEIRKFTGMASVNAINSGTYIGLVLEHHLRIQRELTALIKKHLVSGKSKAEFIREVKRLEEVNIVTKEENIQLRKKKIDGSYAEAGIELKHWEEIPKEHRAFLRKKLSGKVANSEDFQV